MLRITPRQYGALEEVELSAFENRMSKEIRPWLEPGYGSRASDEARSLVRAVVTFARDNGHRDEHEVVALIVFVAILQLERGARPDLASAMRTLRPGGRE